MIKVELLDHMGDDLAVANAARVSMAKESDYPECCAGGEYHTAGCKGNELRHEDARLILYLAKHDHWTPFAHTAIKFRITAPIFLARQLFKHKVGLVENEVSRRYVDDDPEFYRPKVWRGKAPNVKQGSSDKPITHIMDRFGRNIPSSVIADEVYEYCRNAYLLMLDAGVCLEQARMLLPQGMMTEWIWTGSVASFARVFKQRTNLHAQLENQELAKLIGDQMGNLFPISWSALTYNG